MAESGVWHKPLLIGGEESLELGALQYPRTFLCEYLMQIFSLGVVHALIVNLWQGIQLTAQSLVVVSALLIGKLRQLTQVGVLRMQCVDAYAVIRIGVGPCVGDVGVVYGQKLQHALTGLHHPVNHKSQVAEVTHAKRAFTAQREHRDYGAGSLPVAYRQECLVEMVHNHVAVLHGRNVDITVGGCLPQQCVIVAYSHKLKLYMVLLQRISIDVCHPLIGLLLGHGHCFGRIPCAKALICTHHSQTAVLA